MQSPDGIQNFPDSVFECSGIDVIGIHGRFSADQGVTAGTPWADMFVPGNTLTARAQGKQGKRKMLLVEEWEYVHIDAGFDHKTEAIFDQGNALNLRGIPWVHPSVPSSLMMNMRANGGRFTPIFPAKMNLQLPWSIHFSLSTTPWLPSRTYSPVPLYLAVTLTGLLTSLRHLYHCHVSPRFH